VRPLVPEQVDHRERSELLRRHVGEGGGRRALVAARQQGPARLLEEPGSTGGGALRRVEAGVLDGQRQMLGDDPHEMVVLGVGAGRQDVAGDEEADRAAADDQGDLPLEIPGLAGGGRASHRGLHHEAGAGRMDQLDGELDGSERAGQRGDQALEHRDDVELGREVLERGVDGLELLGPAPNDPMHATEVIQVHQQAPDQALVHLAQVPAPRRPGPGRGGR
jgi:hypothetical protein